MSDSEDETAFESADEETSVSQSSQSNDKSKRVTNRKDSDTESRNTKTIKQKSVDKETSSPTQKNKKTMSKQQTEGLSDKQDTSPQKTKTFESKSDDTKETHIKSEIGKTTKTEAANQIPPKNHENLSGNASEETTETAGSYQGRTEAANEEQSNSGWGNWGSWGTSILSAASTSVQTLTSSVEEGFSTVLETVESSLIGPEEIEMIKAEEEEAAKRAEGKDDDGKNGKKTPTKQEEIERGNADEERTPAEEGAAGGGWLSSWGLSKIVDDLQGATKTIVNEGLDISKDFVSGTVDVSKHIVSGSVGVGKNIVSGGMGVGKNIMSGGMDVGKTLMTGGLDVLEALGKTTYEAIGEGEYGLKKSIKGNKPNLSQVLREAKAEAADMAKMEEENAEARKSHFGSLFDEYQGLVHLEALEMLSDQCEGKVHGLLTTLSSENLGSVKKELISIKEAFNIDFDSDDEDEEKEHDFEKLVAEHIDYMNVGASSSKLTQVHLGSRQWLAKCKEEEEKGTHTEPKEIHMKAIQSMAELTAKSVEQFHKTGELVLSKKGDKNYLEIANRFGSLTKVLCIELGILSTYFTQHLNTAANHCEDADSVNPFITNVYLEATNSSTYVQDAFLLLLPVLQLAAVENAQS